jgi:type IV pilus assembly protein PilW
MSLSKFNAGVTLIELMIAMVIGLLIMSGVLQLFVSMVRNTTDLASTNEQIENGRFALQIIENDLVHSGFWGGYVPQFDDFTSTDVPSDTPAAVPEPCKAFVDWDATYKTQLLGISVQAFDSVPADCAAVVVNKKANTDVLVVRHADTCVPGAAGCEADTSALAANLRKVYFQPNFCGTAASSAYDYAFGTSGFTKQKRSCNPADLAEKRKYISNIYYISADNVLMRASFGGGGGTAWSTQPLIEGIEGFVVELGIDSTSDTGANVVYSQAVTWTDPTIKNSPSNRGDGTPDGAFVRCTAAGVAPCTAAALTNVVAAKLHVLVRNTSSARDYVDSKTYALGTTSLGPFNDGFKRHVYSITSRLTNISGRRQTP